MERNLRPLANRLIKLLLPFAIIFLYVFLLYISLDWDTFAIVSGGMLVYFVPPAGKESVIPAMIALGIDPVFAALSIALVDIVGALFLAWNFDLVLRIPLVGWIVGKMEAKARATLERNPWMEDVAFLGLVLFVIVPFQGSGAVGASILGNLISMKPEKIVLAVEIGAISGCLGLAFLSSVVVTLMRQSVVLGVLAIIVIIGSAIALVALKARSAKRRRGQ